MNRNHKNEHETVSQVNKFATTPLFLGLMVAALLAATPARAAIIFDGGTSVDIIIAPDPFNEGGTPGNTVRVVNPEQFFSTSANAADGLWTDCASGRMGTGYVTADVISYLGLAADDGLEGRTDEDVPALRTTIDGLSAAYEYDVYAVFIVDADGKHGGARLSAGLAGETLTAYARANTTDRIVTGAVWDVGLAYLGRVTDVTSFSIDVAESTISNSRSLYLGVGYTVTKPKGTVISIQ